MNLMTYGSVTQAVSTRSKGTPTAGTSSRKESIMDLLLRTSVIHPDHGVVTVELDAEGFLLPQHSARVCIV